METQRTSENPLPVVIIACQVLRSVMERLFPKRLLQSTSFIDYGMHRVPKNMTEALQESIDKIKEPSLVVLGYGLCGNGLNGIQAGIHTLIIPRVDDCIALLLGSRQAYIKEFKATPGTYWLSNGWLESGSHPLKEYREYTEKYGSKRAAWIMDQQYQNYERLAFITYSQDDLEKYRPQALEVAQYCAQWEMRYEEIVGSDRYIRQILTLIDDPKSADDEFIVVSPCGQINQERFWDFKILETGEEMNETRS
jgi:hypothetical protein